MKNLAKLNYLNLIKVWIVFILISGLTFQTGVNTLMNIWYHLGNNSFEKAFCVNIEKPEKSCHGSCMMKKINQAPKAKDDITPFNLTFQWRLSDFLLNKNLILTGSDFISVTTGKVVCYIFNYKLLRTKEFFHPPEDLTF